MKKKAANIVWAIIAIAVLGPFLLTLIINAPKFIHFIEKLK